MDKKSVLHLYVLYVALVFAVGLSSCTKDSDKDVKQVEDNIMYVITAELESSEGISSDYAGYIRSLCGSVYKNVTGDRNRVFFEFSVFESSIMQSLYKYDPSYSDKSFVIKFVAKTDSGKIKYMRSMVSGTGKIVNNDTEN